MAGAYSKPFNTSLFWYYIKQIMNVFIRAMVRIFSFGERWNVPFNSAIASLNGTSHLSPHENILTIALINIHYLYNIPSLTQYCNIIIACTHHNSFAHASSVGPNYWRRSLDQKVKRFLYFAVIVQTKI
jgi:hypothetical protein